MKNEIPKLYEARDVFNDSLKRYMQATMVLENTCRALLSIPDMVAPQAAKQLREALDRLDKA